MSISRRRIRLIAVLAQLGVAALGAQKPRLEPGHPLHLTPVLGIDEYVPSPDANPLTMEKAALGRRLYFDTLLSRDRSIACASCHRPGSAFADTVARSRGGRDTRPL